MQKAGNTCLAQCIPCTSLTLCHPFQTLHDALGHLQVLGKMMGGMSVAQGLLRYKRYRGFKRGPILRSDKVGGKIWCTKGQVRLGCFRTFWNMTAVEGWRLFGLLSFLLTCVFVLFGGFLKII